LTWQRRRCDRAEAFKALQDYNHGALCAFARRCSKRLSPGLPEHAKQETVQSLSCANLHSLSFFNCRQKRPRGEQVQNTGGKEPIGTVSIPLDRTASDFATDSFSSALIKWVGRFELDPGPAAKHLDKVEVLKYKPIKRNNRLATVKAHTILRTNNGRGPKPGEFKIPTSE
jgi:hypothetical protein